ncbi:unnamed protein product [Closterium sp. Yama58-4]|nr:unnamed protein product [Closterium sp. Yama58-4]
MDSSTQPTILAAILLNRTLLVPEVPLCLPATLGRPVVYSEILDIGSLSRCFGEQPSPGNGAQPLRKVITGSDFLKSNGGNGDELVVDKVLCGQVKNSCHFIDSSCGEAKGIKLSEKEIVSEEKGINLFDLAPKIAAATANVPVLSLGDLFYSFFNDTNPIDSTFFWPSRFFNTSCELLFRPPQHVLNQASAFLKEYLGVNYASIHLRRTDFLDYSLQVGLQYWPLQAVAECTASKMVQLNVTNLFVSSDASDEELEFFQGAVKVARIDCSGQGVRMVDCGCQIA